MCKVALIDDFKDNFDQYQRILHRRGIELIFMNYISDYHAITEWILDEEIEFVLVDYKLDSKYSFSGSQLIQYLNNTIPDLQCVLFTSNTADDDLVMDKLKLDKNAFNSVEGIEEFVKVIKQGASVYKNRRELSMLEYNKLKAKKEEEGLNNFELEEMISIYKRLVSYGLVEKVPNKYFTSDLENKIDSLIKKVEGYINEN